MPLEARKIDYFDFKQIFLLTKLSFHISNSKTHNVGISPYGKKGLCARHVQHTEHLISTVSIILLTQVGKLAFTRSNEIVSNSLLAVKIEGSRIR